MEVFIGVHLWFNWFFPTRPVLFMRPSRKIVVPFLGIVALLGGLFIMGLLYLHTFPGGVNPFWEYFWLHWYILLTLGCFTSAYGFLRPRPWAWFFGQLMLVIFYFGYQLMKLVLLGWGELGSFFFLNFIFFALAIGFFQSPLIRERFGIEHTRRSRRMLGNIALTMLATGLVPLVFSFWLGRHFPPLQQSQWGTAPGSAESITPDLPMGFMLSFPKGTRVIDAYSFWIDSENIKKGRTASLKESFVSYSFAPGIILLETPEGTRIVLEERSFVQNLLGSVSARSYFHFLNFERTPHVYARKWFAERTGLFFVIERMMEMDFQWGLRSGHMAQETVINGIPTFVEEYWSGKKNPKRILHFHLYRGGAGIGRGILPQPQYGRFEGFDGHSAAAHHGSTHGGKIFSTGSRAEYGWTV